MRLFNRFFVSLIAIAWGVLFGWLIFVVWRAGQTATVDSTRFRFSLGFSLSTSEQILATIVMVALILPALLLLGLEVFGGRGTVRDPRLPAEAADDRYTALESRLDRLERQGGPPAETAAPTPEPEDAPADPVLASERRPGVLGRFRRHDRAQTA